ncbi:MAG: hypothetical protein ACSNEK_06580 [Parachlamydiaceae bacterium]
MSQVCRRAFIATFSYEHCLSKKKTCHLEGSKTVRNLIKLSAYIPILGIITHIGLIIKMAIAKPKDIAFQAKKNFLILRILLSFAPPILFAVDLVTSTIVLKSLKPKQKV